MVWWITKYKPNPSVCRSGSLCYYQSRDAEGDAVFPSTSIMFTFNNRRYGVNDINYLCRTGVNIFNIDRTTHDECFKDILSTAIAEAQNQTRSSKYYIPVDIVVLKDVNCLDQYLEFRQQHAELSKPVLLWLNRGDICDIEQLIRFSDGVILEREYAYSKERCDCVLRFCKEFFKPLFFNKSDLVKDYYESRDRDRNIIEVIQNIVENNSDGITITDNDDVELPPIDAVRSIVRAIAFAERNCDKEKNYWNLSFELNVPVLPSISTAAAASLAALKCEAEAIFVLTKTGTSARWCAMTSPSCPIVAITRRKLTTRCLHLYKKVIPLFYNEPRSESWHLEWRNRVRFGTTFALKTGLFDSGAKLVVLYPSQEGVGYCNGFQILTVPFKCDDEARFLE